MKTAALVCFSLTGLVTAETLSAGLTEQGMETTVYRKSRYLPGSIRESIREWTGSVFEQYDALIFIGAAGIAVRSIAPYIRNKKKDPAVLVIDEEGKFVISLLSGHLGGANLLCEKASGILKSTPVITTATDLHGKFAVDVFAKENHCAIRNMRAAKAVSAAILAGETVGILSEFPICGELPEGIVNYVECDNAPRVGIYVGIHEGQMPFEETVILIPRILALGIGCKKGKAYESIKVLKDICLKSDRIYEEAVFTIASIDLKKEEQGILALAQQMEVPFVTYDQNTLMQLEGEFTSSSFVKETTGVDSVCERSAVMAAENGRLLRHKTPLEGVTLAFALKNWRIQF